MARTGYQFVAACITAALTITTAVSAQQAPAPAKGEAIVATTTVTATVTKIDHQTRQVTVKTAAGKEYSFVADTAARNLGQVKPGDVVTVTYEEALAYEMVKTETHGIVTTTGAAAAAKGAKPAGIVAQQTTATVTVTAIDRSVPSITFTGPRGNSRTIKVLHPEKLEGVKVGDLVQLTYSEALALKVEEAPKK